MTLQDFISENALTANVEKSGEAQWYTATINDAYLLAHGLHFKVVGTGESETAAVNNLAERISGKVLAIQAVSEQETVEIQVPSLTTGKTQGKRL